MDSSRYNQAAILATRPILWETPAGALAVSGPAEPLQIGVVRDDRQQAEVAFKEEIAAWAHLHEQKGGDDAP